MEALGNMPAIPPPGRVVPTPRGDFHLLASGDGSPTVVVDAGSGMFSEDWSAIQDEVARFTRVVTTDRAGYGWSGPARTRRTARDIVLDLHATLEAAGEHPPYVLVGHSLGGHTVRVFADQHREEVAGMVLVDVRPDSFSDYKRARDPNRPERETRKVRRQLRMYLLFLTPPLRWLALPLHVRNLDDAARRRALISSTKKQVRAMAMEAHDSEASDRQVRAIPDHAGVPLIVINHDPQRTRTLFDPAEAHSDDEVAEFSRWWLEYQQRLASSNGGRLVIAAGSGHIITADAPEVIVEAIRGLVDAARQ